MNPEKGWIKLWRAIEDNPRCTDPDWRAVWTHLLLNATHRPIDGVFGGRRITLQPGQLITGRFKIAQRTGVQESKVKRLLEVLKNDHQIDQQAGNKSSIITIVNWQLYQAIDQQNDHQPTSKRPASDHITRSRRTERI